MKNENEVKHTPTPWVAVKDSVRQVATNDQIATCYTGPLTTHVYQERANAAHIVHCVNTHDELVEALEEAKEELYLMIATQSSNGYFKRKFLQENDTYQKILSALKKARP